MTKAIFKKNNNNNKKPFIWNPIGSYFKDL